MKVLNTLLFMLPFMAYASAVAHEGLTKISRSSVHVAHEVRKMSLYHNGIAFLAKQNGIKTELGSECLDGALRNVSATKLPALLRAGHIQVTRTHDGSLMLRHCVDGKGGGFAGGAAGFWIGKGLIIGNISGTYRSSK